MATITIEEGLVYGLSNNAGVVALVSTRVYHIRIPQGATIPCITIARVDTPRVITHDTSGSAGTAYPRIQIDAWAVTQKSAKQITDAIRAYLNGFHNTMGGGGNTVTVQAALVDEEVPEFDPDVKLYRGRSDYIIWHVEA